MVTAEVPERQTHLDVTMPRSRSLVARRLCALRFIETFDDAISLQPGEPIDPKDPIELIDLVLETYGEQTIGLFDLFHAAQILVAHPHTGMAFDLPGPDRPSLAKALSTLVEYSRFRNRFGSVGTGISRRFPASAALGSRDN